MSVSKEAAEVVKIKNLASDEKQLIIRRLLAYSKEAEISRGA